MENESLTSEDLMRIDVSSIMHSISLFVARFGPEIPIRTRLRFCTLAEGVSARVTQQLGLGALHYRKPWPHAGAEAGRDGGESGVEKGRLSTLDIICGWMVTTSVSFPHPSLVYLAKRLLSRASMPMLRASKEN